MNVIKKEYEKSVIKINKLDEAYNSLVKTIAEACGKSAQTVERWRKGITAPSMLEMREIARVMGLSEDEVRKSFNK